MISGRGASSLEAEGPEVAAVEVDPEALGPSSGTIGCVDRACSLPPRMKDDDEINIFESTKLLKY